MADIELPKGAIGESCSARAIRAVKSAIERESHVDVPAMKRAPTRAAPALEQRGAEQDRTLLVHIAQVEGALAVLRMGGDFNREGLIAILDELVAAYWRTSDG